MIMDRAMYPMPEFDIPEKMASQIADKDVGSKVSGIANYEVIHKDETGIKISIDSIYFKSGKRKV